MIQIYSNLEVADNTGARRLRCIQVMGGTRRRYAHVGDVITATVKEALPNSGVKKGDVVKAVIVRTKQDTQRRDGTVIPVPVLIVLLLGQGMVAALGLVASWPMALVTVGLLGFCSTLAGVSLQVKKRSRWS